MHGFCYDESNDDFKVFTIFGYEEFKVAVYSLKSDSWRIIGDFSFALPNHIGETACRMTLGTFDKSLSILYKFKTHADLWVMKECGLDESWTKLFTIPHMNGTLGYPYYTTITSLSVNGNIILNFGWELSMELNHPKKNT